MTLINVVMVIVAVIALMRYRRAVLILGRREVDIILLLYPRRFGSRKVTIACPVQHEAAAAEALRTLLPGKEIRLPLAWNGWELPRE